jgi:Microbial transglutaminase
MSFDTLAHALAVSHALNDVLAASTTVRKYGEEVGQHPLLSKLTGVVSALPSSNPAEWRAVVFSKRFYANQDPDWNKRKKADKTSFKPDATTGQVDMSSYKYKGRPDPAVGPGAVMVNFDYGWYDETTDTWWHANHSEPGMKVYQSTLGHYSQPLLNFDRQVFSVALAKK